jgi:hypothetical protein
MMRLDQVTRPWAAARSPRRLVCLALCVASVSAGCIVQSNFTLSEDSRLPRPLKLPAGVTRSSSVVTLIEFTDGSVSFSLKNKEGALLADVRGRLSTRMDVDGNTNNDVTSYPRYTLVTLDGGDEVLEFRRPGPIFYLTDDPMIISRISRR